MSAPSDDFAPAGANTASAARLSNDVVRRLFLERNGLSREGFGREAAERGGEAGSDTPITRLDTLVQGLGLVQIDSINTVARAHHMILRPRLGPYREPHLTRLHDRERKVFEHWTHDASFIPMSFFPYWSWKFRRDGERLRSSWKRWQEHEFEHKLEEVLDHIARHGPASSGDVGSDEPRTKGGWWDWHPSKTALEYLWRTGALSVTRRDGFKKVYDLTENVIPQKLRQTEPSLAETVDFACSAALDRLGFATPRELAAFFELITPQEADTWCAAELARGALVRVELEGADGRPRPSLMRPQTLESLADLTPPPGGIRILSPFDPALRDRKRALAIFDFDYRIEIYVPEAQRRYGYYVFPVLEGERMVGRIDMKAHRDADSLRVTAFWPEPGLRMGAGRLRALEADLSRMARFCGVTQIAYADSWLREPMPRTP